MSKEIPPLKLDKISYYSPSPYGKFRAFDFIDGKPILMTPQIVEKRERDRTRIEKNLYNTAWMNRQYGRPKEKGARPLGNRFGK